MINKMVNLKKPALLEDLGMEFPNENSKRKYRYGLYLCICGKEFKTRMSSVKNGSSMSCGCYRNAQVSNALTTHGMKNSKLYHVYNGIKDRVFNIKNKSYKNYGGRGISICDEWKYYFLNFYHWAVENGYRDDLTIDRINNDGDYEPSNCRWASRDIQAQNTRVLRSTNTSGYRGVNWHKRDKQWYSRITINYQRVTIGTFDNAIEAAKSYNKYVLDNNLEHPLNEINEDLKI